MQVSSLWHINRRRLILTTAAQLPNADFGAAVTAAVASEAAVDALAGGGTAPTPQQTAGAEVLEREAAAELAALNAAPQVPTPR